MTAEVRVKDQVWDAIWDEFWPVSDVVRKHTESDTPCDPDVLVRWQEMRNTIVSRYYYLVQRVAERLAKKITERQEEELASMGVDGLYDSVDGYGAYNPVTERWEGVNPKNMKPVKFETYAAYRIKGSIIDEIRRDDWVPRLVRSRRKDIEEYEYVLSASLGRKPTSTEMAVALKISVEDYDDLVKSAKLQNMQSLNAAFNGRDHGDSRDEDMAVVFTPLERRIVHSYYFEGRSMKEISETIGLSESRVSQMNTDIIKRLQEKVRRNPDYFGKQVLDLLKK
jgi:RNA polymerase sigma factor for flagellar operon FliA